MFYYNKNSINLIENRIEALKLYNPNPNQFTTVAENVGFYYHDKEFSKIDWNYEPPQSLQDLYRIKAEKIRQDYEYVILAYSGGMDSSQVLETFYYNNIHIDEILMVGAFSQDSYGGSDENHNKEIYDSAWPILNELQLKNTKITNLDYTTFFNNVDNFSLIQKYGSDWINHIGCFYSLHNLFWHDISKYVGPKDKKTCVVFALEKAMFLYDRILNKPYTVFSDHYAVSYGNMKSTEQFSKVYFYNEPSIESTNILRKQLHLIKDYYLNEILPNGLDQYFNEYKERIIDNIIYKVKNKLRYRSWKSKSKILSDRDRYIINHKNSDIYKIYTDGIKKLPTQTNVSFLSRRYYFE